MVRTGRKPFHNEVHFCEAILKKKGEATFPPPWPMPCLLLAFHWSLSVTNVAMETVARVVGVDV